ncbi:2-C-methyl-D-erythritol 4-phosphate cytidylyltransferase [Tepidanaerobacter syntrophicus]|uniref:2-C-methyl-D-erythritol 4-phosphate cytidylyltransferase n=1 Tax=Tepidanaerobacter syntrophicus TaxID=224999 RepID=UPI0022EEAD41|nr:2-C-methyl-D-erythritol 4-phosphate cytidylyltransferase [Tepidanaerobacter syntrophicus]GLI20294.1 2-C-methyl-D-erythritol 4-phosphate cytidylyltransferase [Tepidanaerobacter syntrophicus]GLI51619.1 2-C-methyl-D-erythritol 4-phosphate cytidylyltransferase [Tepidanaerobacter syntrophicus]
MQVCAVIAAGGQGKRMNSNVSKQFLTIKGHPILYYTLNKFEKMKILNEIILVVPPADVKYTKEQIIKKYGFKKTIIVEGGKERQDSVYNGLKALPKDADIVVIHDGVRPFIPVKIIENSIEAAAECDAVGVAVPVKDTIKVVDDKSIVKTTPDRKALWAIQTPQTFKYDVIMKAYEKAMEDGFYGTDDTVLVERMGLPVKIIEGSYENIKITTPEDIIFAEAFVSMGLADPRR